MTTSTKLRKATFKHIESELYNYHETLSEIERLKNDIIHGSDSSDENVGGGRSSEPGRPTERIATRLTTHKRLNQLEEIANAIQKVFTNLTDQQQKMVKLKYWTRPQTKTWDGIAEEIPVNRATAIRWRDTMVNTIAEILGWR
ncbi:transcriptional regulator [Pullulanibacillus sp. KACC 23026]|uniref:transcriptional regulator n=1 Tax=Pullulanibacillus sp. KACC 23026 TaxID=3028315 RepID=UPI0023B03AA0|nr:transcriptional regulator [Pullulanibacillus sp. KACC 23026]WEG14141.1 transcriptional regulator [Pullulanibacillus sp. KACC 23026]